MNQENNLLTQLSATLPDLNKSEAKVANAILEDPEAATRSSIAVLAAAANVSEPSVNRFCKRFGASGFPDFKLRLARSLVSGVRYISRAVEMDDDIHTYPRKLFDNTITALMLGSTAAVGDRESGRLPSPGAPYLFFGVGDVSSRGAGCGAQILSI